MENIVLFTNVCKKLGNQNILENVSFNIKEHDIFGYLGPNGAGKTTTIRLLLGLLEVSAGNITVLGDNPNNSRVRQKIGYCFDNDGLYANLTAYENMRFFDMVYSTEGKSNERIMELLKKVKLAEYRDKYVSEFSRGMRKRLGLARALLTRPQLLVLDEPMIGLDPEGQACIKDILKKVNEESTIFISSHNLNDVQELCNKVAIMNRTILVNDTVKNLLKSEKQIVNIKVKDECEKNKLQLLSAWQDPEIRKISQTGQNVYIEFERETDIQKVYEFVQRNEVPIQSIGEVTSTLYDKYFSILEEVGND